MKAGLIILGLLLGFGSARGGDDVVTAASVDATTGASKQLEPIRISEGFSVAYAVNDDGSLFLMARDLVDAYGRDELASDGLFKSKAMVIKGTVERSSKPDAPKPWVVLSGEDARAKKVRCSLRPGQLPPGGIEAGRVIQIRGVCEGMTLNIIVSDAEITGYSDLKSS